MFYNRLLKGFMTFYKLVTVCWVCGFDTIRASWHHCGRMQELKVHETAKGASWIVCVFVLYWTMRANSNNGKHMAGDAVGWLLPIVCTLSNRSSIPGKGTHFFYLLRRIQTGSGAHWASSSVGTGAISPGLEGGGSDFTTIHCQG